MIKQPAKISVSVKKMVFLGVLSMFSVSVFASSTDTPKNTQHLNIEATVKIPDSSLLVKKLGMKSDQTMDLRVSSDATGIPAKGLLEGTVQMVTGCSADNGNYNFSFRDYPSSIKLSVKGMPVDNGWHLTYDVVINDYVNYEKNQHTNKCYMESSNLVHSASEGHFFIENGKESVSIDMPGGYEVTYRIK